MILGATAACGEKMAAALSAMNQRLHENAEQLAENTGRLGGDR
jgi:hypothetical protein